MRAILVRIGVDNAFGKWNAPVDPVTGEFVYVPIPESTKTVFRDGMARKYDEFLPALNQFCNCRKMNLSHNLRPPAELLSCCLHLDPDFEYLTYGDDGSRRGAQIKTLQPGDLIVFYAGLKPVAACEHKLIYALVGLYVVDRIMPVTAIDPSQHCQNAHCRKTPLYEHDIVIRARAGISGRLERCISIGHFHERAYRVRPELLHEWGGLSVKGGYIQRSAVPPEFLDATRFYSWFQQQNIPLLARNN